MNTVQKFVVHTLSVLRQSTISKSAEDGALTNTWNNFGRSHKGLDSIGIVMMLEESWSHQSFHLFPPSVPQVFNKKTSGEGLGEFWTIRKWSL